MNEATRAHPEEFCEKCGVKNVVWFAPNDIWNAVTGNRGILCPMCFIEMAEEAGFRTVWKVAPESEIDRATTAAMYAAHLEQERLHAARTGGFRQRCAAWFQTLINRNVNP